MPVSFEKLILKAYDIIIIELKGFFSEIDIDDDTGRLKLKLKSGITVFIGYNNYNQYSYVIMFSSQKLDRVRFDNFDEKWNIISNLHHTHLRFKERATESPFKGKPEEDIKKLCSLLRSGDIYNFS